MSNHPKKDTERSVKCDGTTQRLDQYSPEIQQRLQSAAKILANGAIRLAAKQAQNADLDNTTGSS